MKLSSIGLSGMTAASDRMVVAAHNIANSQAPDFRRQRVVQESLAEGVASRVEPSGAEGPGATGDLIADVIDQKLAVYSFQANLRSVVVERDLQRSLLNLQA